jgi:hypothetical protein
MTYRPGRIGAPEAFVAALTMISLNESHAANSLASDGGSRVPWAPAATATASAFRRRIRRPAILIKRECIVVSSAVAVMWKVQVGLRRKGEPQPARRVRARGGANKAIGAVAASMFTAASHGLRDGTFY